MMKDKKTRLPIWSQIIICSLFAGCLTIITGVLIGLVWENFNNQFLLIKIAIWLLNILLCYFISFMFFKIFKFKFHLLNFGAPILSSFFSAVLVILLTQSFEYEYVIAFGSIGTFEGILKAGLTISKKAK